MNISFGPRAHEDRRQIWFQSLERFGEKGADDSIKRIDETLFAILGAFPNAGRARPEFGADMRSVPIVPFVAFYRVAEQRVEVVRILHGQRDLSGPLLSLLVAV